jgi:hypothetical protein
MFSQYADEIELGRYVHQLSPDGATLLVEIEPHAEPDGSRSTHVFDIYRLVDSEPG